MGRCINFTGRGEIWGGGVWVDICSKLWVCFVCLAWLYIDHLVSLSFLARSLIIFNWVRGFHFVFCFVFSRGNKTDQGNLGHSHPWVSSFKLGPWASPWGVDSQDRQWFPYRFWVSVPNRQSWGLVEPSDCKWKYWRYDRSDLKIVNKRESTSDLEPVCCKK